MSDPKPDPVSPEGRRRSVEGNVAAGRRRNLTRMRGGFITALRNTGNVRAAARIAGVDRKRAYLWRERDAKFAAEWEEALEDFADLAEAEATRRAIHGIERAVYGSTYNENGRPAGTAQVGMERVYSDTLLIFMLKALRPERFRDTAHMFVDGNVRHTGRIALETESDVDRALAAALAELQALPPRELPGAVRTGESPADVTPGDPADDAER